MTSPTDVEVPQKPRGGHKILVGTVLSLAVVLVLVILFGQRGLYQIFRFHREQAHLEQENARLAAENERLARTIERLQHDPEMIEDLIRRELNFVKKNELIFQFPPEGQEKPAVTPPSPGAGTPPAPSPPGVAKKTGASREPPEAASKAGGRRGN